MRIGVFAEEELCPADVVEDAQALGLVSGRDPGQLV
jgi:hypothetical protein